MIASLHILFWTYPVSSEKKILIIRRTIKEFFSYANSSNIFLVNNLISCLSSDLAQYYCVKVLIKVSTKNEKKMSVKLMGTDEKGYKQEGVQYTYPANNMNEYSFGIFLVHVAVNYQVHLVNESTEWEWTHFIWV